MFVSHHVPGMAFPLRAKTRWQHDENIITMTNIDARSLLLQLSTVSFNTPRGDVDDPQSWIEAIKEAQTLLDSQLSYEDSLGEILTVCTRVKLSSIANTFCVMLAHVQLAFKCQK